MRRKRKRPISERVTRFLQSNSIAKIAERKAKKAQRTAKRSAKKIRKVSVRYGKKATRISKRLRKKLPKKMRRAKRLFAKAKRSSIKSLRRTLKAQKRITKRAFNRLAKPVQLRGKQLKQRRQEQRQEIKGTFDTSRSIVIQASEDPGASKPGEPPKMRSGEGRYSIKAELRLRGKKIVSRTYVDKKIAPYMAMWEFRQDGEQRPFLKPGLMNNIKQFQTKVGAELKRAATQVPKKKAVVK